MMKFRKSPSILGLRFSQVIHDDILKIPFHFDLRFSQVIHDDISKITFHFGLRFPQATPKQWKNSLHEKSHQNMKTLILWWQDE